VCVHLCNRMCIATIFNLIGWHSVAMVPPVCTMAQTGRFVVNRDRLRRASSTEGIKENGGTAGTAAWQ